MKKEINISYIFVLVKNQKIDEKLKKHMEPTDASFFESGVSKREELFVNILYSKYYQHSFKVFLILSITD